MHAQPCVEAPAIDDRRHAALRLLVLGKSVARIARELEVSRQTIYRWREDPAFEAELKRLRDQAWGETVARLKGMLEPSLNALEESFHSKYETVRLNTAMFLLRLPSIGKAIGATAGSSQATKT